MLRVSNENLKMYSFSISVLDKTEGDIIFAYTLDDALNEIKKRHKNKVYTATHLKTVDVPMMLEQVEKHFGANIVERMVVVESPEVKTKETFSKNNKQIINFLQYILDTYGDKKISVILKRLTNKKINQKKYV